MSKRLLLTALVVTLLCAAPAFGAIQGTAHDQAIGAQGTCSACHIPHKAAGSRLWPEDMSLNANAAAHGTVGGLCYYCHGTGGGAAMPDALQSLVMDLAGDAALSHGRVAASIPAGDAVDATLPYGGAGVFECSTCHDVHDDTDLPFLQDDIDVLCARCHTNRQFVNGVLGATQGAWGPFYGPSSAGSHPMGTDVHSDTDGAGNSPVDLTADGRFNLAWGASELHNLGGHLTDGGAVPGAGSGMTCATCHSVHGVQDDFSPPGGGVYNQAAVSNLLTVPQPTAGGAFLGAVYNGNGDATNALCEACHSGFAGATIDSGTGVAYAGANNVNPGGTANTHPVDDLTVVGDAGVAAFPANWPIGSAPGANVAPAPICESCHTPHPRANIARATITQATGSHLLRGSEVGSDANYICASCHDFSAVGNEHHPANVAMGRMSDPLIGNNDATLTCDDCHGAGSGAHNWTSSGVGLDPDWEPAGNGKGTKAFEQINATLSKECVDCHIAGRADNNPTNNGTNGGALVPHAWRVDSPGFQDIGEGTHFLGANAMDYTLGSLGGGAFNATTTNWTDGGWSRFDGALGTVACESCHELEPDKNTSGTALLLEHYKDGGTAAIDDPSGLCEGCHGTSPGGSGTPHPMTGDGVTRTGANLVTNGAYTRAAIEGNATYPAGDALNCDSCHQPHDADTGGGTYIYDSGEGMVPPHDVTSANLVDGSVRGSAIAAIEDAPFCDSCHFYLN